MKQRPTEAVAPQSTFKLPTDARRQAEGCCPAAVSDALPSLLLLPPQVFLEDAGFDWKILGPDVSNEAYVAWQCDQDAYACSGQKCSAQSVLFMHSNWAQAGALSNGA